MSIHTLRDNQSQDLADKLGVLLPKIVEEEQHSIGERLLEKLQRCKPKLNQVWSQLYLSEEEDELYSILCTMVWASHKPKPDEGSG